MKRRILQIVSAFFALVPFAANAQYHPNLYRSLTLPSNSILVAGATSNYTATATLRQGVGLSILADFWTTNASTAGVGFHFDISADGVNYTTTKPIKLVYPLNGTTPVRVWTNYAPKVLSNIRSIRLTSITNGHDASIWVSNVVISYSN